MCTLPRVRCLTLALGLSSTLSAASAQPVAVRALVVQPPRSVVLGRQVTLSVQGATQGARYRFVAVLNTVGANTTTGGKSCRVTQSIGSGASVTWLPPSGTYRLTAYGPLGHAEVDTLSLTYDVVPRTVMLAAAQTQMPNGLNLTLRTDDLGPGRTYVWSMRVVFKPVPSGAAYGPPAPPISWSAQTTSPMTTYPTPLPPPRSITASVKVHAGDPCAIIAAGMMQRTY